MKRTLVFKFVAFVAIIATISLSMKSPGTKEGFKVKGGVVIEIPAEVQVVIDKSCVMCHNSDSNNSAAKIHLSFDKFKSGDYTIAKAIGKLDVIIEVIDGGKMPPKKFQENNPQKALSENDKALLKEWANQNIKKYTEE